MLSASFVVKSTGGPYAAIYDLSATKRKMITTDTVRFLAHRIPSIPMGRPRTWCLENFVFQMCREQVDGWFHVVHTMEEVSAMVEVRPEDFTKRLFPKEMAT